VINTAGEKSHRARQAGKFGIVANPQARARQSKKIPHAGGIFCAVLTG
jgi:hypothetical protein